ncbi:hypothetical protein BOTCAL_0003g00420 [Botryotinia calthae]|uniref:Uncharacterized protein n=1 Tax=Botryotinia calthae TaxID=38488 RepID=A0A4Y8DKB8_9HELO|nr:hypothetical protein BOTCAL_0003g00420 [Botryotinia calthae]
MTCKWSITPALRGLENCELAMSSSEELSNPAAWILILNDTRRLGQVLATPKRAQFSPGTHKSLQIISDIRRHSQKLDLSPDSLGEYGDISLVASTFDSSMTVTSKTRSMTSYLVSNAVPAA